jgi:hypothetical protein
MPLFPSNSDDTDNMGFITKHDLQGFIPIEDLPDESEDLFEKVALAVDRKEDKRALIAAIRSFVKAEREGFMREKESPLAVSAKLSVAACCRPGIFLSNEYEEYLFGEGDPILPVHLAKKFDELPRNFSPKRFSNRHGKWSWK